MAVSSISCGSTSNNEAQLSSGDCVYQENEFTIEETAGMQIDGLLVKGDKLYISGYDWSEQLAASESEEETNDNVIQFFTGNVDGTNLREIAVTLEKEEALYTWTVDQEGSFYLLLSAWNIEAGSQSYILKKVDKEGNTIYHIELNALLALTSEDALSDLEVDEAGNIYILADDEIYVMDNTCSLVLFQIQSADRVDCITLTKDGEMIAGVLGEKNAKVKIIDTEKKAFGNSYELSSNAFSGADSLIEGLVYDFYYHNEYGLYGYDMEKQQALKLIDWMASELSYSMMDTITVLPDGNFLYLGYNTADWASYINKLVKEDSDVLEDKIILTLAGIYVNESVKEQVIYFNQNSDKYKIEIIDYGEQAGEEDPVIIMNTEMIAGNVPDIIYVNMNIPMEQYAAKGLLEDLYPYLDGDESLSREDLIPTVLNAMSSGDHLYQVAPGFSVCTVIGKTSDVGEKTGWTMDEMLDLYERKGDEVSLFPYATKEDMLTDLCAENASSFVNWETGECSFYSDAFIEILEFSNVFVAKDNYEVDGDSPKIAERIQNGEVLLQNGTVGFLEVQLYGRMFGEDITFIGWPSQEKTGTSVTFFSGLAMYAKSENKDGAWEFIRTFLTKEYQYNLDQTFLPTRQDVFNMQMKEHTTSTEYIDEYGKVVKPWSSGYYIDDYKVEFGPMSQEEAASFQNLVDSIDHMYYYDQNIMNIVLEEAESYFNGEKSAEEVAEIIQNRVQTYVNENR